MTKTTTERLADKLMQLPPDQRELFLKLFEEESQNLADNVISRFDNSLPGRQASYKDQLRSCVKVENGLTHFDMNRAKGIDAQFHDLVNPRSTDPRPQRLDMVQTLNEIASEMASQQGDQSQSS